MFLNVRVGGCSDVETTGGRTGVRIGILIEVGNTLDNDVRTF